MIEPAAQGDPLIGQTLGAYRVEEEVGRSRWGRIYRAWQSNVHRYVALKILAPEIAAMPGKLEHFMEESRTAASLVHPHIVAVYEAGHTDTGHFCAREFMDGPPLTEFLRKGNGVDEHRLLLTIAGIARALNYLWQRNFPHQPPQDDNVLTNTDGAVKLINIEIEDSPPSASPQDDMLALGLLVGHLANEIALVSKPVAEFVERMVGAHDRKPFASLVELAETAEHLDHQLFPPAPPPPPPRVEKIAPKKTRWILIGAACVIVAGIAAWIVHNALTHRPLARPAVAPSR